MIQTMSAIRIYTSGYFNLWILLDQIIWLWNSKDIVCKGIGILKIWVWVKIQFLCFLNSIFTEESFTQFSKKKTYITSKLLISVLDAWCEWDCVVPISFLISGHRIQDTGYDTGYRRGGLEEEKLVRIRWEIQR